MQDENFVIREPLLNAKEQVLGYELSWQHNRTGAAKSSEADASALVSFIAEQINETESGSLLGDHLMFLAVPPALLKTEAFGQLPPKSTVIALHAADLTDADTFSAVRAWRAKGYAISLREADLATIDRSLLAEVTHVETPVGAIDFAVQVQSYRLLNLPSLRMVVRNVGSWQHFEVCAKLGLDAFVGKLHLTPKAGNRSKELNPAQAMILQLMDMVSKNADVRQLEQILKRDPALSYKLLRYINSAGFGLGCEIQSLKHAVTMLGYSPLYRWLALLLATASTSGYSPVLMQTAVIRGRFVELLGQFFLPKNEAENLFVTGMFSLLDKLLGVPMDVALAKIQLSNAVSEALLTRQGIYGPFLALAEACELNTTNVESMATSLCISARQVNQAQLSALAWGQRLKL
jgi:c-di-GMP-related signal transduction protein